MSRGQRRSELSGCPARPLATRRKRIMTAETPTVRRSPQAARRRPPGRWEATGYALLYLLMWPATLAVFIVTVVGIPLVLVTAGVLLLLWSVPLLGALASAHRRCAENILGVEVPDSY